MFLLPCQGSRTVGRECASQTLPEGKQQRGPTTLLLLFFCPLMAPQGMWNMRPATAAAVGACGAPGTDAQKYSEHWFRVPRMPPWRPQSPGAHAPHGMRRGGGWSPTQHPPRHAPHAMRSGPRKPAAAGPETGRSPQLLHFTRNPAVGGADPSQPRAAGRVFTAPAPLYNARPARPPRAPNEPEPARTSQKLLHFRTAPGANAPPLPKSKNWGHFAIFCNPLSPTSSFGAPILTN